MAKDSLRFRQVHLDFHTSPAIPGIGKAFDNSMAQKRPPASLHVAFIASR